MSVIGLACLSYKKLRQLPYKKLRQLQSGLGLPARKRQTDCLGLRKRPVRRAASSGETEGGSADVRHNA
jgi:hypothetical protein